MGEQVPDHFFGYLLAVGREWLTVSAATSGECASVECFVLAGEPEAYQLELGEDYPGFGWIIVRECFEDWNDYRQPEPRNCLHCSDGFMLACGRMFRQSSVEVSRECARGFGWGSEKEVRRVRSSNEAQGWRATDAEPVSRR